MAERTDTEEPYFLDDIFADVELDPEEKEQVVGGRLAGERDSDSFLSVSDSADSIKVGDYLNKEENDFLSGTIFESDQDDKLKAISREAANELSVEELEAKEGSSFLEETASGTADFLLGGITGIGVAAAEVVEAVDSVASALGVPDLIGFDEWRDSAKYWVKNNRFTEGTAGKIGQGIGQFMTGFFPIFRAIKGISYLNSTTRKVVAADALTSGLVFNPKDPNTFNMVQHIDTLKPLDDATGNAVTKMLATDPKDPELYNRFRNAAAGVLEGAAIDKIFGLLKIASLQMRTIAQDKLGMFREPYDTAKDFVGPRFPEETLEALEENRVSIEALNENYNNLPDNESRTATLKGIASLRVQKARLEGDLSTNKPYVEESAYDFNESQLSRDSQEQIRILEKDQAELDARLKVELGEEYAGQSVNFKDDITKAIYIVTDSARLEKYDKEGVADFAINVKSTASKDLDNTFRYQDFLTDEVGMSTEEIFEIGKRIDRDLKKGKTVGDLRLYRLEIQKDILNGDLKSIEVQFNPKINPEKAKAVNVPISQAGKALVKPILGEDFIEDLVDVSSQIIKEGPLWKGNLFKDLKIKTVKGIEKTNIKGQPKYIFKGEDGVPFQIEYGSLENPQDLDNLYTWLRMKLGDKGVSDRVALREEEAKAAKLIVPALSSGDPLGFMLERGISAETAILSRLIHGTSIENLYALSLKRTAGDKTIETQNKYLQALAYVSNAHIWQATIARKASQATRAFGHAITGGATQELLEQILNAANSSSLVPYKGGLDKLSEMIAKVDSLEGVEGTIEAVMNKSGVTDVMMEYYMGVGLLSGVSTQLANLMGGLGVATVMQPIEKMTGKFWGGHSKSEAVHELIDGYVGLFGGTWKNMQLAAKTVWEGKPQGFSAQKMEIRHQTITGESVIEAGENRVSALRFMGNLNRGGTRFLIAGDDFVRTSIHTMQVTAAARKQARSEGLSGQAFKERATYLQKYSESLNDYDAIKLESTRLGDEATFTQKLDGLAAALGDHAYKYPLIRLFTPFVKVMYNLPKYFIERDPLSQGIRYGVSNIRGSEFAAKINTDVNVRNNFLGKMSAGTMLLGAGTYLAMNGVLTGSARKDYGQEKNKMMINHFSNSIRFTDSETGKVVSIDYSRLEPYASFFQYSADLFELVSSLNDDGENAGQIISQAVWALSDNVVSDTWVPGLTEFLTVISGQTTERAVKAALKRMVSGFTPAISRELGRSPDRVIPESKGGAFELFDDKMVKYGSTAKQQSFQQLLMRMYSTIPGYNGYPKYDRWGNMMMRGGSDPVDAHPIEIILPWNVKRQKYDKVDEYIDEIELEISDLKPAITIAGLEGGSVPLNPAQFEQYHLLATKDLSGLPKGRLSYKDIIGLRKAPSRLKRIISEQINAKGFKELQVSGFSKDDNQREIIKQLIYDERALAREILAEIKGNEGLTDESNKRREIARENPNEIFN